MIELFVQSRYHVNRKLVRKQANTFLKKMELEPERYVVSIAVVGDRKVALLHKKYAGKQGTTPVLTFPYIQSGYKENYHAARDFSATKEDNSTILLGEIIISYPQTLIFAADENKLVDDKLCEFVEHGLKTLLTAK
jgi:ssRNA-specific RNase YbeY (16S rRNA maturation enzyme)